MVKLERIRCLKVLCLHIFLVHLLPAVAAVPPLGSHVSHNAISANAPYRLWAAFRDQVIQVIWPSTPHLDSHKVPYQPVSRVGVSKARHRDEVVIRFYPRNYQQASELLKACDTLFLDVWERNSEWIDVRLAKHVVPSLLDLIPESLHELQTPLMQGLDLKLAVAETYPNAQTRSERFQLSSAERRSFTPHMQAPAKQSSNPFFEEYQPLSVIQPWMRLLRSVFPTHVRVITIGKSYEGRDILAFRLGVHPNYAESPSGRRKTIIVAAGFHARDWISTSTVNYVANSLITSYGKSSNATKMLEHFDWILIPTLNPDGYVYSFSTDRFWRKNRQPTSLSFCRGIDLDRVWSDEPTVSESNPCSEDFLGDSSFEAVESQALASWALNETLNNDVDFVGFLNLQSYSQTISHPLSGQCLADERHGSDLDSLGHDLAEKAKSVHNEPFNVITACLENAEDAASDEDRGSSMHWFFNKLHVPYSYTFKLRDQGGRGFLLSKDQIVPSGEEMLRTMEYFGQYLHDKMQGEYEPTESTLQEPESAVDEAHESLEESQQREEDAPRLGDL